MPLENWSSDRAVAEEVRVAAGHSFEKRTSLPCRCGCGRRFHAHPLQEWSPAEQRRRARRCRGGDREEPGRVRRLIARTGRPRRGATRRTVPSPPTVTTRSSSAMPSPSVLWKNARTPSASAERRRPGGHVPVASEHALDAGPFAHEARDEVAPPFGHEGRRSSVGGRRSRGDACVFAPVFRFSCPLASRGAIYFVRRPVALPATRHGAAEAADRDAGLAGVHCGDVAGVGRWSFYAALIEYVSPFPGDAIACSAPSWWAVPDSCRSSRGRGCRSLVGLSLTTGSSVLRRR